MRFSISSAAYPRRMHRSRQPPRQDEGNMNERPENVTASGDVHLLLPPSDVADPEVTILVPALDEEITIGRFVDWCQEGIKASGAQVEILIVDSSTDRTPEIALAKGARVLKVPKRGLGRAYIDAMPFVRGRCIIMGDADCTYDF